MRQELENLLRTLEELELRINKATPMIEKIRGHYKNQDEEFSSTSESLAVTFESLKDVTHARMLLEDLIDLEYADDEY